MKSAKYRVRLSLGEQEGLRQLLAAGVAPSRKLTRARILLKADENGPGWTDNHIQVAFDVSLNLIARVRKQYVQEGLDGALERHPTQRLYERRLDGVDEAHLIALACSPAPVGRQRWTLRLLAEQMVALGYIETVSYETVRRVLKKRA